MTKLPAEVIVYGSSCPACTQAKAVLDRFGIPYETRAMTDIPRRHGRVNTMPQIVIDGELLGGLNQLLKLARSGGLTRLARSQTDPWVQVSVDRPWSPGGGARRTRPHTDHAPRRQPRRGTRDRRRADRRPRRRAVMS